MAVEGKTCVAAEVELLRWKRFVKAVEEIEVRRLRSPWLLGPSADMRGQLRLRSESGGGRRCRSNTLSNRRLIARGVSQWAEVWIGKSRGWFEKWSRVKRWGFICAVARVVIGMVEEELGKAGVNWLQGRGTCPSADQGVSGLVGHPSDSSVLYVI
jgi:hypothetical protein